MNKAQRSDINIDEIVVKGKTFALVSTELLEIASELRSCDEKGE